MTAVTVVRKIRRETWSERKRLVERGLRRLNVYNDREEKRDSPTPRITKRQEEEEEEEMDG